MYEVLIKLEEELEYRKYTIEDLKELKKLLEGLKTEEVRLWRVEDGNIKRR